MLQIFKEIEVLGKKNGEVVAITVTGEKFHGEVVSRSMENICWECLQI